MEFNVEGSTLVRCVDDLLRLAVPATGNLVFDISNGKLEIASLGFNSAATIKVPASGVKGEMKLGIQAVALRAAITKTNDYLFVMKDGVLTMKSKKSVTSLPTFEVAEQPPFELENAKKTKITAQQASWITQAIKATDSKTNHTKLAWIPIGIRLTEKGAFVSCYEMSKLSWTTTKEVTGDATIILPREVASAVASVFDNEKFTILTSPGAVRIENPRVIYEASVPTSEGSVPFEEVYKKHLSVGKEKSVKLLIIKSDIQEFLNTTKAVTMNSRGELQLKGDGTKMLMSVSGNEGSTKTTVKAKSSAAFQIKIDLELFAASAAKAPEEWELGVGEVFLKSNEQGDVVTLIGLNDA